MDSIAQCSSCQKNLPSDDNSSVSDPAPQNFCASCLYLIHQQEILKSPIENPELSTNSPNLNQRDPEEESQQMKVQDMRISEDDELILDKREKLDELQKFFEHHIKRVDFERQVMFAEEEKYFEKIFEKNKVSSDSISEILNQLSQNQITSEYLNAYDEEEKLTFNFQHHKAFNILVKDNHNFREGQNLVVDDLKKFEGPSLDILKSIEAKLFSPETIRQVSKLYKSQAEAMFMIINKAGLFKFDVSDEEWLTVSPSKGEESQGEVSFEKIKNFEKVDVKLSREEDIYIMILGIKFLLENCFEKAWHLYLSFCKRYITDKETKSFNDCALWKNNKIKSLTLDFTECTFENEETPLLLLRDKTIQLENLEELRLVLNDSSASCKTTRDFHKEIIPRLKSLKSFEFSFHSLPFSGQEIYEILQGSLSKMSNLEGLSLELEKMQITDEGISLLFDNELPKLKNLKDLKLWLNETQITDQGFLNIFKSLQKSNYAQNLEMLALGLDESNISDESLIELANNVLPLMKNLKKFWIWVDDTSVTDKSLIPLCQNIKHFAANLKVFVLSAAGTSATDETVDAFVLESLPLMKNLEHFHFWFPESNITDQSLVKFFETLYVKKPLENVKKLWLYFGETEITDQSLTIFAEKVVPTLAKLQEFNFSFDGTKVSDSSLQPLFANLSIAGTSLSNLIISLSETELGKQSILALAEAFGNLKNLKTLSLGLNKTNLEDSSVNPLFASFKSFAGNLQRLILSLEGTRITDQSLLAFGNEFKSLKEFKLWASETEVGDLGLKFLFESLKGTMVTMDKLFLFLTQTLITDEGLLGLAETISSGARLQEFDLWAIDTNISDSGASALVASLKNSARNMRKLTLSLAGSEISDVTCDVLCEKVIRNMCNLQELTLFLSQTEVTDASLLPFLETLAEKVHNVRVFEFQFNDMNTENSVGCLAKKVLVNLTQVQELRLFWDCELSGLTYRDLCVNAQKTIRNINTFQISESQFSLTTDFRKPYLQEINFELNDVPEITDRAMKEILQSFKDKVSHVKSFSFQVNRTQISHGSLEALGGIFFPEMIHLESLILELEEIPFPVEAFFFMCQKLQYAVTNLKLFRIQIDTPGEINGSCLKNLAEYGLVNMKNLESLSIRLSAEGGGEEEAMKVLLKNLQYSAKTLKYFELFLNGPKLSREAVQALAGPTFSKFEELEAFSLSLFSSDLKDEDFVVLFSNLEESLKNTTVTSFALTIDEKNITNITMNTFLSVILPQLTNLDTLKTYFGGIKFDNESLKKLNKKLQETDLQNLSFKFGQNSVTSEAVNEFALNVLPSMKSLKTLEISFDDNSEVNNEAIVNLFGALREIIGDLTSLELDFSKTGLTNVGIEVFKEKLAGELEHLERFEMDITGCSVSAKNQNFINELAKY